MGVARSGLAGAQESCPVTGEMLISAAGRVARAYIVETPGVFRSNWSIEDIAAQADVIRHSDAPVEIPAAPAGFLEHLKYSFAMAKAG